MESRMKAKHAMAGLVKSGSQRDEDDDDQDERM
jgi:hypothetical protein